MVYINKTLSVLILGLLFIGCNSYAMTSAKQDKIHYKTISSVTKPLNISKPIKINYANNKISNEKLAELTIKPKKYSNPINKPQPQSLTFETFKSECEEIKYISGIADRYRNISQGIRQAQMRAMRNLLEKTNGVITSGTTIEEAISKLVQDSQGSYESTIENFKDKIKTESSGVIFPKYKTFSNGDQYRISNKIITVMVKPQCNRRAFRGLSNVINNSLK